MGSPHARLVEAAVEGQVVYAVLNAVGAVKRQTQIHTDGIRWSADKILERVTTSQAYHTVNAIPSQRANAPRTTDASSPSKPAPSSFGSAALEARAEDEVDDLEALALALAEAAPPLPLPTVRVCTTV